MAETSARQGTKVTFLDQTGSKSVEAVVSDSITVRRILPNIITKLNLPVVGPDGQPMSYSLDHKEGGKRLLEDQTLLDATVSDGDHLIVYPEIVAGAVWSTVALCPTLCYGDVGFCYGDVGCGGRGCKAGNRAGR